MEIRCGLHYFLKRLELTLILNVMCKASAKLHVLKNWELLSFADDVYIILVHLVTYHAV